MQLEHPNEQQVLLKEKRTPFSELYEADNNLVNELIIMINSLFSPLAWILQETLQKRVKKQDKGWIQIQFLHRNNKLKNIFKRYDIPSHCRRKNNLLNRAIENSFLKRKRNLIKRRDHININNQLKKVIYFQSNKKLTIQTNLNQENKQKSKQYDLNKDIENLITEKGLKKLIENSLHDILKKHDLENNKCDKMELQRPDQLTKDVNIEHLLGGIELIGNNIEHQSLGGKPDMQMDTINQSEVKNVNNQVQQSYRWCFFYLPKVEASLISQLLVSIKKLSLNINCRNDIELLDQMNGLNLFQADKDLKNSINSNVKVYSLSELIEQHYLRYEEVCKRIGYCQTNRREQRLKLKQKLKQRQKHRLLQSQYLDKKIDLVNQYHVKLKLEKQRKSYFQQKQHQFDQKRRMRQEKRLNKFKKQQPRQKKTMNQRLKQLLNINDVITQKKQERTNQTLQLKEQHNCISRLKEDSNQIQNNQFQTQPRSFGKVIKLPKHNKQLEFEQDQLKGVQMKFGNQNENIQDHYEDDEDDQLIQSSQQQFDLPKKRNSRKKDTKIKKISKSSNFNNHRKQHQKFQSSNSKRENAKKIKSQNPVSNKHQQSSNSSSIYNLRHKTPIQGSYLKMVETFSVDENLGRRDKSRTEKQVEKSRNFDDDRQKLSNNRNRRSSRKHYDKEQ